MIDVKSGDRVYSIVYGWGNVLSVYCDKSFSVKFAKSDLVVCYDIDGRSEYDINHERYGRSEHERYIGMRLVYCLGCTSHTTNTSDTVPYENWE